MKYSKYDSFSYRLEQKKLDCITDLTKLEFQFLAKLQAATFRKNLTTIEVPNCIDLFTDEFKRIYHRVYSIKDTQKRLEKAFHDAVKKIENS